MRQFLICFTIIATLFCFSTAQSEDLTTKPEGFSGDFYALLLLIPEEEIDLFYKPEPPKVSLISKVECDEKFAVKVIIRGMSLGEDNIADVTFDMQMTKADGKVSEISVHKDLPLYQGVVAVPENVYNNDAVPVITLEAGEPFGFYTIDVLVNDNIGKRSVALSRQIELVSCSSVS